jgi:hypothetical protein
LASTGGTCNPALLAAASANATAMSSYLLAVLAARVRPITMACTKSFRYPFLKKVLLYECISETEFAPAIPERVFQPNYFVDISTFLNKKLEIMTRFESEVGEHPFPRSLRNIEALATYRGATAGVEYAEAFQLVKMID